MENEKTFYIQQVDLAPPPTKTILNCPPNYYIDNRGSIYLYRQPQESKINDDDVDDDPTTSIEEPNSFFYNSEKFSNIKIRHGFIRKVYCLISIQLLITVIFGTSFKFVTELRVFFEENFWLFYVSLSGILVLMIILALSEKVARFFPINLFLLFLFTTLESIVIGCVTTQYKTHIILISAFLTFLVVTGITIFAFQTKFDFTGGIVYYIAFGLILVGLATLTINFRNEVIQILYAAGCSALYSFCLIFDTQMMMGGKHKYTISPEDYIVATLSLYIDVINLFLMIFKSLTGSKH